MKKIALIVAMSSIFALTACQKEVTEVEKGSNVEVKTQQLSTNSAADVQADMDKIQTLATAQESKAGDLNARLTQALQSENEADIKKLFPEFKAAMQDNLKELKKIQLKSTEVTSLRNKLSEMTLLGLQLQEQLLDENVTPEAVQPLQAKGEQLQQEILMISQNIQMITSNVQSEAQQAVIPAPTQAQ